MPNTQSLPQTRGNADKVVAVGTLTGTGRDRFFNEGISKSGKHWKSLNFGVDTGDGKVVWFELFGSEKDKVYAYRPAQKGESKGTSQSIAWANRHNIPEGFRLIGVGVGLETDENGRTVYNNLSEIDAIDSLVNAKDVFTDGAHVRINAKIDFNTFENKQGEKITQMKYIPQSISVYEPTEGSDAATQTAWSQNFIISGIDADATKVNPEGVAGAYRIDLTYVGYHRLAHTSVYTYSSKLAKSIKNELKKGQFSCDCWGYIEMIPAEIDTVETTDEWGEENPTDHVSNNSFTRDMIMTGCRGADADHETYTEDAVAEFAKENQAREEANIAFEGNAKPKTVSEGAVTTKKPKDDFDDWGDAKSDDLPF